MRDVTARAPWRGVPFGIGAFRALAREPRFLRIAVGLLAASRLLAGAALVAGALSKSWPCFLVAAISVGLEASRRRSLGTALSGSNSARATSVRRPVWASVQAYT